MQLEAYIQAGQFAEGWIALEEALTPPNSRSLAPWRRSLLPTADTEGMARRSKSFLIDSVIVIDHLNGIEAATEFLRSTGKDGLLSVITRAEVLSGVARQDLAPVKRLLDRFKTLEITAAVADRAARLRRRNGWKLPDGLQAALAIEHGSLLATRSTRDFPPRRFRFVRVPYRDLR
jgi:hypothetical protein